MLDDDEIVDLFLSRNETALDAVQKKYGARIRTLAFNLLSDAESAKEVENDTYLQAWSRIPPHEPRDYLFPFLGRIARHIAIDRIRSEKAAKRSIEICELSEELMDCLPSDERISNKVEEAELLSVINEYLKTCNSQHTAVFVRRYWFFDSISSISQRYGMTESNVKQILWRMRRKLRQVLVKRGYYNEK